MTTLITLMVAATIGALLMALAMADNRHGIDLDELDGVYDERAGEAPW